MNNVLMEQLRHLTPKHAAYSRYADLVECYNKILADHEYTK